MSVFLRQCDCQMIDDDWYTDRAGRRVLLGLSFEETEEFVRLDAVIATLFSGRTSVTAIEERRWSDLSEKHEVARMLTLPLPKAQQ